MERPSIEDRVFGSMQNPVDVVTTNGGNAVFAVQAGGSEPLTYQWWLNETNQLIGETNSELILSTVGISNEGDYSVSISNAVGIVRSGSARLTVLTAPFLIQNPADVVTTNGDTAGFVVQVGGSEPLAFQWWFNQTNLLVGATNTSLLLSNVSTAAEGFYHVSVSNSVGMVASAPASLTILTPPFVVQTTSTTFVLTEFLVRTVSTFTRTIALPMWMSRLTPSPTSQAAPPFHVQALECATF